MKRYDRWTEADRQQLAELAKVHSSNRDIAAIMRRPIRSTSWQRRKLRIKLLPAPRSKSQAKAEIAEEIEMRPSERIDRMMALATGIPANRTQAPSERAQATD